MNTEFLLDTVLKFLDEGVLVVDQYSYVTFLNEPAGAITGIDRESAVGRSLFDIFPQLSRENSTLMRVMETGKPLVDYIQTYTNHKGQLVTKVTSTIPLYQDGDLIGALEIYREISHLKRLIERLSALEQQLYYKKSGARQYNGNGTTYAVEDIIGISPGIRALKDDIVKVSDSGSSVLIYGETGTGKELCVQGLHNASAKRRLKPFIAQNCAAIPHALMESILFGTAQGGFTGAKDKPGLFELANHGTLFLDEINALDFDLQAKLLRVLQDGVVRRVGDGRSVQVKVRVVAATNERPEELVAKGRLRADLYYRLNVISLNIAPLRDRKEDIPALVAHFIAHYNAQMGLPVPVLAVDGATMASFMSYHWPGNVRELQFAIERMINFASGPILSGASLQNMLSAQVHPAASNLPRVAGAGAGVGAGVGAGAGAQAWEQGQQQDPNQGQTLAQRLNNHERQLIIDALNQSGGNGAKAARLLGLPRQTLHHKMKKQGILGTGLITP